MEIKKAIKKIRFKVIKISSVEFEIWDNYLVKTYPQGKYTTREQAENEIKEITKHFTDYYFERISDKFTYL